MSFYQILFETVLPETSYVCFRSKFQDLLLETWLEELDDIQLRHSNTRSSKEIKSGDNSGRNFVYLAFLGSTRTIPAFCSYQLQLLLDIANCICQRQVPIPSASAICHLPLPLAIAINKCQWHVRLAIATGSRNWHMQLAAASGNCQCIQTPVSSCVRPQPPLKMCIQRPVASCVPPPPPLKMCIQRPFRVLTRAPPAA